MSFGEYNFVVEDMIDTFTDLSMSLVFIFHFPIWVPLLPFVIFHQKVSLSLLFDVLMYGSLNSCPL